MEEDLQASSFVVNRTVYISGAIDDEMALSVMTQLETLDDTEGPIRIVLNSEGGEEQPGYAIHDTIRMCKNHVTIDGFGSVMSIAAAIFQAGDLRRLAPNALFMIHDGSVDSPPERQVEIVNLAERIKRDCERYYRILSDNSRQPLERIQGWCKEETYFTADEACAAGFADETIKPVKSRQQRRTKRSRK